MSTSPSVDPLPSDPFYQERRLILQYVGLVTVYLNRRYPGQLGDECYEVLSGDLSSSHNLKAVRDELLAGNRGLAVIVRTLITEPNIGTYSAYPDDLVDRADQLLSILGSPLDLDTHAQLRVTEEWLEQLSSSAFAAYLQDELIPLRSRLILAAMASILRFRLPQLPRDPARDLITPNFNHRSEEQP